MNQENLNRYKSILLTQRDVLEDEIKKLETPPAYDNVPGNDDEIDESTEYFNTTASADDLRDEVGRVERALLKIEQGTYGICEATGKEIPPEVLEINPVAVYHPDYQRELNK